MQGSAENTERIQEIWEPMEEICLCRSNPPAAISACTNESKAQHSRETRSAKIHKNPSRFPISPENAESQPSAHGGEGGIKI